MSRISVFIDRARRPSDAARDAAGIVCLLALAAGPLAAQAPKPIDTSAKAALAAAAKYVDDYHQQLSLLIAEEDGTQKVFDLAGSEKATRTTKAEIFVTFLEAEREWMTIRDVSDVDGRPLTKHEDIRALLTRGPVMGLARTLADESARFNIGGLERNVNDPLLALLVLEPRRLADFKFSRTRVDSSADGPLVTLAFTERDEASPLVSSRLGRRLRSKGEVVINAAKGRIERTTLQVDGDVRATLVTTYGPDARLGLWVPQRFSERYESTKDPVREIDTVESTYANYKRFEVQVRIKTPLI